MRMINSNMHTTHTNAYIYITGPLTGVPEKGISESGGGKNVWFR
jgi:hypothetical protein